MKVSFWVAPLFLTASISAFAGPACFSPKDLEAAHLRALYQQFQVASLNCQTAEPGDPTFRERYSVFVERFNAPLQTNSAVLKAHFGKAAELDRWITKLANDAGQAVITKPDFCQIAWDRMDESIALEPAAIGGYALKTEAAGERAPPCPQAKTTGKKKKK